MEDMNKFIDVKGWEGLYKINSAGEIINNYKERVGNYYYVTLYSGYTDSIHNKKYYKVNDLIFENFGEYRKKVYHPSHRKKKKQFVVDVPWKTTDEYISYMQDLMSDDDNKLDNYENYFMAIDITIDQIIDNINYQIGCPNCCRVLNYPLLEIEWKNNNLVEITTGFLSFIILRYIHKRDTIKRIRMSILYEHEQEQLRRVKFLLYGEDWMSGYVDTYNEDEMDDDTLSVVVRRGGKNGIADRSLPKDKQNLFLYSNSNSNNEYEEDEEVYNYKLNYSNFIGNDDNDVYKCKLEKVIYNNTPYSWKINNNRRINISKKTINEIVTNIYSVYKSKYSLSEIIVSIANYVTDDIFNIYKKLDIKYQKIILNEIGKGI